MMCAYLFRFHLSKLKSRALEQKFTEEEDEENNEKDYTQSANVDDDSDAAFALSLALQEYDEHISRSGGGSDSHSHGKVKGRKSGHSSLDTNRYMGEIHHQESVLKSYLSANSRGPTKASHDIPRRSVR